MVAVDRINSGFRVTFPNFTTTHNSSYCMVVLHTVKIHAIFVYLSGKKYIKMKSLSQSA